MEIIDAVVGDAAGIAAIYNDAIANTTSVYSEELVTPANRREWMEARQTQHYPVLVARDDSGVVGYSSFGDFRPWPGYRFTVELAVYVRSDRRRMGIGRQLLSGLFPYAARLNKRMMIAGIDADNLASLSLHERLGFKRAAHLHEVGFKFGRWLDLVLLERPV